MTLKELVSLLSPPLLLQVYGRLRPGAPRLSGEYRSWEEAVSASTGYGDDMILEKTRLALLKVKNGDAAYERDSVVFADIQHAWPLLAGLLWVAARSGGTLNVLDFGGSLGSTYFQNRAFLRRVPGVLWNIIEQPRHVETGRQWFEDECLRFYFRVEDCLAETQPNVILLSSVLQYLEHPYELLGQLLRLPCDHVIIDRTPIWGGPADRLCVQYVPRRIYRASYPSWIFSEQRLLTEVQNNGFETVAEVNDPDRPQGPISFAYKGMIGVRSTTLGQTA